MGAGQNIEHRAASPLDAQPCSGNTIGALEGNKTQVVTAYLESTGRSERVARGGAANGFGILRQQARRVHAPVPPPSPRTLQAS
jgi:hypothetical protein